MDQIWRQCTWKRVFTSLLFALLFGIPLVTSFFGALDRGADYSLDTAFFYNADTFHHYLQMQGAWGRDAYLLLHVLDYGFMGAFFALLISALACVLRRGSFDKWKLLLWIPVAYLVFDLLEGITIDISLLIYPSKLFLFPSLCGYFTLFKMLAVYASCAGIVIFGIWGLFRKGR